MVFLALTRSGYEDILAHCNTSLSLIWVNKDILSIGELRKLRESGVRISDFNYVVDIANKVEIERAIATVEEHHFNESVWVENVQNL